jgi:hypothetical protein
MIYLQVADTLKNIIKMLMGPVFTFVVSCAVECISSYMEHVKKALPHVIVNAYVVTWVKYNNPSGSELTTQPGPRHARSTEFLVVFDCVVPGNLQSVTVKTVQVEHFFRYQKVKPEYPGHILADLRRLHFKGKVTDGDLRMDNNVVVNKSQKPKDFTAALVRT